MTDIPSILILSVPGSGTHALMNLLEAMRLPPNRVWRQNHLPNPPDYSQHDGPIIVPVRDPILSLLSRHKLSTPIRSVHIDGLVDGWLEAPTIKGAYYFPLGTYEPVEGTTPHPKYEYLNGNPQPVIDIFGEDLLHNLRRIAPWVKSLGIEAFRHGLDTI